MTLCCHVPTTAGGRVRSGRVGSEVTEMSSLQGFYLLTVLKLVSEDGNAHLKFLRSSVDLEFIGIPHGVQGLQQVLKLQQQVG